MIIMVENYDELWLPIIMISILSWKLEMYGKIIQANREEDSNDRLRNLRALVSETSYV